MRLARFAPDLTRPRRPTAAAAPRLLVGAVLIGLLSTGCGGGFVDTVGPSAEFSAAAEATREQLSRVLPEADVQIVDATVAYQGSYDEGRVKAEFAVAGGPESLAEQLPSVCRDIRRRLTEARWATDVCIWRAYGDAVRFSAQKEGTSPVLVQVRAGYGEDDLTVEATAYIDQLGKGLGSPPCFPGDDLICIEGRPVEASAAWAPVPQQEPVMGHELPDGVNGLARDDLAAAVEVLSGIAPNMQWQAFAGDAPDSWRLHAWQADLGTGTDARGACLQLRAELVARSWDTEVCGQDLVRPSDPLGYRVDVWKALVSEGAYGRVHLFVSAGEDTGDADLDAVSLAVVLQQSGDPLADLNGDFCFGESADCLRTIVEPQEGLTAWPARTPELQEAIDRARSTQGP